MKKRRSASTGEKSMLVSLAVTLVILALGTALFCKKWYGLEKISTDTNIEYILEHIGTNGKLVDFQNEIGVKSIEDFRLYEEGNKITLYYGKIILTWDKADLVLPDNLAKLKSIGISVCKDTVTNRLVFLWQGQEIERWVK